MDSIPPSAQKLISHPVICMMDLHSKIDGIVNLTNLESSVRATEVRTCRSRPARYSPSIVCRSCAINCTRASSCDLLAWTCSTDERMNLNAAKAGARQGTGARYEQWRTVSMSVRDPMWRSNDNNTWSRWEPGLKSRIAPVNSRVDATRFIPSHVRVPTLVS